MPATSERVDRLALASVALGHLASDLTQGALPALLPFLILQRHLSYAAATALLLALTIASSIIQPLVGLLSDRTPGAWLMPLGVAVGGAGMGLAGLAPGYLGTLGCVILAGIGVAAFHPEGARYIPLVSGAYRTTGMSVFSVGGNAGFVLGPLIVTAGVALFGLGGTWLVAVVPTSVALLLFGMRGRLVRAQRSAHAWIVASGGHPVGMDAWGPFAAVSGVVVARTGVTYGLLAFIPVWFVRHLHSTPGEGNAALTLMLAAGVVGTILGGRLADRYGIRGVMVGAMLALFPLTIALPFAGKAAALVLLVAIGIAMDANFSVTIVLAQQYLPTRPALASGVVIGLAIGLGGVIAAALGLLADHAGLPAVLFAVSGFALASLLLSFFCPVQPGTVVEVNLEEVTPLP